MREDQIKTWRNVSLAWDIAAWLWQKAGIPLWNLSRRWWVVSIPLATYLFLGFLEAFNVVNALVVILGTALAAWLSIKAWKRSGGTRPAKASKVDKIGHFGSEAAYAQAKHYYETWPEVARHAGLCQRKESYGLGTLGAAREALRASDPSARLDQMAKGSALDDLDFPEIVAALPSPLGIELHVKMLPGQDLRSFERASELIGHQWGVEQVRIKQAAPGIVGVIPVTTDPLANVVTLTVDGLTPAESLKAVEVGRREDGSPWLLPLDQANALYGGIPGSGKSSTMNTLIARLAPREDVMMLGIDCTGGPDFVAWKPRFSSFADTQQGGIEILEWAMAEFRRRVAILVANEDYSSISEMGYSKEMPLIAIFVDEFPSLFCLDAPSRSEAKELGGRAVELTTQLVTMARKAGIFLHLATPQPTSDTLPTRLRNACQTRACFRVAGAEMVAAVLGEFAPYAPIPPSEIPLDRQGMAVAADERGQLAVVRSFYSPKSVNREIAKAYAHLAPQMHWDVEEDIIEGEVVG